MRFVAAVFAFLLISSLYAAFERKDDGLITDIGVDAGNDGQEPGSIQFRLSTLVLFDSDLLVSITEYLDHESLVSLLHLSRDLCRRLVDVYLRRFGISFETWNEIKDLVDYQKITPTSVYSLIRKSRNILVWSALNGQKALTDYLILKNKENDRFMKYLIVVLACAGGHLDLIKEHITEDKRFQIADILGPVAAKNGHYNILEYLEELGLLNHIQVLPGFRYYVMSGNWIKYEAARNGHLELLRHEGIANQIGHLIIEAATGGQNHIITYILDNFTCGFNQMMIYNAAIYGHRHTLELILERFPEASNPSSVYDDCFIEIAQRGLIGVVNFFLERGLLLSHMGRFNEVAMTKALYEAVNAGHFSVVNAILTSDSIHEINNYNVLTMLMTALNVAKADIFAVIYAKYGVLLSPDMQQRLIQTVYLYGHNHLIEAIAANGTDPRILDLDTFRAIDEMINGNGPETFDQLKSLLENSSFGKCVIFDIALRRGNEKLFVSLLKFLPYFGEEFALESLEIALKMIIAHGQLHIAKALVDNGLEISDFQSGSFLHLAVAKGHIDMLRFMIENGVRVVHGKRLFETAYTNNQKEMMAALIEFYPFIDEQEISSLLLMAMDKGALQLIADAIAIRCQSATI